MDADIQDVDYTGDPELLYQIWTNLLDNAIKFSNPGGHIRVRLRREEGRIAVTVEDTGIGMDEQTCSRMFEQFYRGEAGRREGSGLGLPWPRRIAELHGGTITGESRAGEGPALLCFFPHRRRAGFPPGFHAQFTIVCSYRSRYLPPGGTRPQRQTARGPAPGQEVA